MHNSTAIMATATSALATRLHARRRTEVLLSVSGLAGAEGDSPGGLDLDLLQRASLLRANFALRVVRPAQTVTRSVDEVGPGVRQASPGVRSDLESLDTRSQGTSLTTSAHRARELVTA